MAPHRRDTRLGFKYFESSCWETLVQYSIAIEEENIRSDEPFATQRCGRVLRSGFHREER